jgi:hypothetical protein
MSLITVTAGDVKPLPGALCRRFDTGAAVVAGNAVYIDSNGAVQKVDASNAVKARAIGFAVADNDGGTSFASGDAIDVCVDGPLAGFSSMAEGSFAYSGTIGQVDTASAGSGNYLWIVGTALSTTVLMINPFTTNLEQLTS